MEQTIIESLEKHGQKATAGTHATPGRSTAARQDMYEQPTACTKDVCESSQTLRQKKHEHKDQQADINHMNKSRAGRQVRKERAISRQTCTCGKTNSRQKGHMRKHNTNQTEDI